MENEYKVEPYPKWKVLAKKIEEDGLTYGDRIDHDWINEALGLDYSNPGLTYRKGQKLDLERLSHVEDLKNYLLIEKKMALKSLHSVGYLIVTPEEQAEWAQDVLDDQMNKALNKAAVRLNYTDVSKLSDDQKKERVDAMARAAGLKSLVTGKNKLGGSSFARLTGDEK